MGRTTRRGSNANGGAGNGAASAGAASASAAAASEAVAEAAASGAENTDALGGGTATAANNTTATMAELELRRYIASQNGCSSESTSTTKGSGASASSSNGGRKRRRSARGGGGGDGGSSGDHAAAVDYHRVRTARLTRLEEMFWRDDAGYDSEQEDIGGKDANGEKEDLKKDDDQKDEKEEEKGESASDDDKSDWRLIRRLPRGTWLRCDGHGCRRRAVATWVEKEQVPPAADAKDDDADADDNEEDDAKMKKGNDGENDDDDDDGTDDKPSKKQAEEEVEEEWNVCLACQKREFAEEVSGRSDGWPAYVDAVPVSTSHTLDSHSAGADTSAFSSANANAKAARPPVHLNYGRRLHLTKIHDSPHIYIIDNFLTEGELKHMDGKIADAESGGNFEKSFVDKGDGHGRKKRQKKAKVANGVDDDDDCGGEEKKEDDGDGNDNGNGNHATNKDDDGKRQATDEKQRTSRFIHFRKMQDSKIAAIEARAAELLQLPHSSIEPLQLVRYGPGQYFKEHHDMGVLFDDGSVELPPRVLAGVPRRVVTILVYLNDLPVEAGGGTQFPYLSKTGFGMKEGDDDDDGGIVIHPKRGRAVVWANIDQTGWPDPRTVHEGMPLIRGAKMPSAAAKTVKKEAKKKEKKKKKEPKPKKPKKPKKPRKSKKKLPPPPRPRTDQILRYIVVPRSDPTNPVSSFGMKVGSVGPEAQTVLTTDWEHPHMAQRLGLQLGRLKKDDVVLSVNGLKVFDPVTEKVLLPFRVVVALMRATKPGRAMKLDILRHAPKVTVEEVKAVEDGAMVDGCEQPDAALSNEQTETSVGDDVKMEAEDSKVIEAMGDEEMEEVKSGEMKEAREKDANAQVKEESEPELDLPKAKPLPLLKYAMNIWACEE